MRWKLSQFEQDLVSVERRAEERTGELQVALHDLGQRWYYFPEMQMDEALLFKTFDSETEFPIALDGLIEVRFWPMPFM